MSGQGQQTQSVLPVPQPPPFVSLPTPPVPPDNPTTDEEKEKLAKYETWLSAQEKGIQTQLQFYETEIAKLRKQRKVSQALKPNWRIECILSAQSLHFHIP